MTRALAAAGIVLGLVACEADANKPPPPPTQRNEAVIGTSAPVATTPTAAKSAAPRAPRKVCTRPPAGDGKPLADVAMGRIEASGSPALSSKIPTGEGKWTWVNLWAAWCGPCKEEMPVLKAWESRLGDLLRVAFVSIDDDERLSRRFLDSQPQGGVRASYHLGELEARKAWLDAIALGELSKLPVHVLVDPQGVVRCVIDGAIETQDLPAIEAFLRKGR